MAIITRSRLKAYAQREHFSAIRNLIRLAEDASVTVFICHNHKDTELIAHVRDVLAKFKARIYVDWEDHGMPSITNSDTATRIKSMIRRHQRFVLLASDNALASRWVPWELGFADAAKGIDAMATFPVQEDYSAYQGNEYVSLYPRIEQYQETFWYVKYPSGTQRELSDWLT